MDGRNVKVKPKNDLRRRGGGRGSNGILSWWLFFLFEGCTHRVVSSYSIGETPSEDWAPCNAGAPMSNGNGREGWTVSVAASGGGNVLLDFG